MPTYTPTSIQALTQKPAPFVSQEIATNAPGAMQYNSGAYASMVPPTIPNVGSPAAAAAPGVGPAPEPTIGETLTGIKSKAMTIQGQLDAMKAAEVKTGALQNPTYDPYPTYKELYPDINEKEIARRQRKLFQSEIDATNRVYDDMLNQERLAGQGRLGTGRAIAARGGLLGSDFGEAQRSNIIGANQQAEGAVQNERMAKIGTILGTMRKAVADEITEKRNARQQGAENYVKYLADASTRKDKNRNLAARAILDAGLDPTTMDPAELEAVGKEAGLSAQEIIMAYKDMQAASEAEGLKTSKTQAEIAKIEADIAKGKLITIGEGTMLYDTETGETFKNPKTYAPGTGSGLKVGGKTLDSTQVSDVHQTLQENRGQDGYTDTGKYMDELAGFVSMGGDPKDFIKEYSPDVYINPKDPSRSFLESQMKKQTSNSTLGFGELSFESL